MLPTRAAVRHLALAAAAFALVIGLAIVFGWRRSGTEREQREPERAPIARAEQDQPLSGAQTPVPAVAPDPEPSGHGLPHAPPTVKQQRQPTLADVLQDAGDLNVPGNRERAVARMREIEKQTRTAVEEEAKRRGLPLRIEGPDGRVQELKAFEDGQPVYFTTHNANAAISSGVSALRAAPYSLDGAGVTIGLWDGGSARSTHQEFAAGGRVTVQDGSASIDHATHVAGTLAAAGVVTNARGMAPAAMIDSYDWNLDASEMLARAAAAPGQAGMLYLSNQSYGIISGWNYTGGAGTPARTWEWWGNGTTSTGYEYEFGCYNSNAKGVDSLAYSAPYFLMFRSAGNERLDNPVNGETVALAAGSTAVYVYSSASHPGGDGSYRGGFDTIGFEALAKNVVTVGSVTDAVLNGTRDAAQVNVSSFSSWGPTDDGRIKPDLVANGDALYSSLNGSDTAYGTYSGTSMATPNAAGTAALLVQQYGELFPGGAMRASSLKALLIQTADDRGNAGPDYKYGWGLINGVAAADLLRDHAAYPLKQRLTEGLISTATPAATREFVWDGHSAIRVTLCWTDPAGTATTSNDSRTARLVNNLQLKVTGPTGTVFLPYVMPFAGTWTQAAMDLPATTGVNNVDNVEQVFIAAPPVSGVYSCAVSYSGTLTNSQQSYSLLISGSVNEAPPPPVLSVSSISPASSLPSGAVIDLTGTGFASNSTAKLTRTGQAELVATSVTYNSATSLRSKFELAGAAPGLWDLTVTNSGTSATLPNALSIASALWGETFEGSSALTWTRDYTTSGRAWSVTTAQSLSPLSSCFVAGSNKKSISNLYSPAISIPQNATNLQLRFWQSYNLESGYDGGKLEFSIDGGAWFDVTATGSGASFAANGYTTTAMKTGSDFAGLPAWTGSSGGFVETMVSLTNISKYAGHALQVRWRLATNASKSSVGWYVDDVSLTGGTNQIPVIAVPATTSATETVTDDDGTVFQIVRGQAIGVSVAASDDGGEPALIYSWSGTPASGGILPTFSVNDNNAAKVSSAVFEEPGDYLVTATARDGLGLAASSSVHVRVVQTASGVSVSPATASVTVGGQMSFSATLLDQFGLACSPQPLAFNWSLSGGGSIDSAGVITAAVAGGPFVVTATNSGFSGVATLMVNRAAVVITLDHLTQVYDGTPKTVAVTTMPAGIPVAVTYDGATEPPIAVGSYAVAATVSDPNYQGGTSGVLVIESPPPYDSWAETNHLSGAEAREDADPDGDGTPNLIEFATGMNPDASDGVPVAVQPGAGSLNFAYSRNKEAADLEFQVEWSDDLAASLWSTEGVGPPVVVSDDGTTERVQVAVPTGEVHHRFVRLRVTRQQ